MTNNINQLSERELEILQMVATGAGNKEIAQKLSISTNTVKVHLRNVFSKINVSSRTEATMWAVRNGLVQTTPNLLDEQILEDTLPEKGFTKHSNTYRWIVPAIVFLAVGLVTILVVWQINRSQAAATDATPTSLPGLVFGSASRWKERSPMPSARSGLAAVAYEEKIYAIGGNSADGISDEVTRYDPDQDVWSILKRKPTPVKFIQGVVIGGKIYIPGGELASGEVSDVFEVYNLRTDTWEVGVNLPRGLSRYALVAFEGRLYLFGGWDGSQYSDKVYQYTPGIDDQDIPGVWLEKSPLPLARGFLGAAVSGGKIYVMGGLDNTNQPVARTDIYTPALDDAEESPWAEGMPLPEARARLGMTNVGDLLFVIGGVGADGPLNSNLQFFPAANLWQRIENPIREGVSDMGVVTISTQLFTLGGSLNDQHFADTYTYQAVFTIAIPFAP
jgi:DNA-binding CsgD family transcriptional regulator/N-acetylneuraminic acid mutarotase